MSPLTFFIKLGIPPLGYYLKTIFLTNDDGFDSYGLLCLKEALASIARVVVVAPAFEKSACSHSLCVNKPLRLLKLKEDFYKLDDGTPTDCVYVGVQELFAGGLPNLLVSGINIGANMGEDTIYSGTVAGAIEGAIQGIPSIAISQCIRDKYGEDDKVAKRDFSLAIHFIQAMASSILNGDYDIGGRRLLNVNVPPIPKSSCKGLKVTQLGYRIYNSSVQEQLNPRGQEYIWIGVNPLDWKERDNSNNPAVNDRNECMQGASGAALPLVSDFSAVNDGYISITPLQLDSTSYTDINRLDGYIRRSDLA